MGYLKIEDEIKYCREKYNLEKKVEDIFIEAGYSYIELSAFENLDRIISIDKNAKKESIAKVLSGNSDILALRFDNTTSIVKNFIPRWQKGMNLKLFYNSTVFRNNLASHITEIDQIGIEYLGESDLKADKEIIGLALKTLKRFNNNFILEASNSKYIDGLFEVMNINEVEINQLKELIYRKNKFELLDYAKRLNLSKEIYDCLSNIFDFQGKIIEIANKAQNYCMNQTMEEALEELTILNDFIDEEGYSEHVHFDLSMIMESNYYDGLIFKGYSPNSFKDIISGGRYDSFTTNFGQKVPAIGFSLDLDELIKVYLKKELS